MQPIGRRTFLSRSAKTLGAAAATTALAAAGAADKPNERLRLAVMGVRGRGKALVGGFSALDDVEVAVVCEVDDGVVAPALKTTEQAGKRTPRVEKDVRRVIDDKSIDALAIAAPDHWHALATIWACQAGKDVYVEKPISHNVIEGRRMVEAARKYERVVQVGTQRRSAAHLQTAVEFIRSGKLGKVPMVRTWIAGNRPSIGHMAESAPPAGVDYDLWTGPAPLKPFKANRFHYEWHWCWDYGTGEVGNNGVHFLDIARWGLGVDYPLAVNSSGGKFYYDDDRETPDTQIVTIDYPYSTVVWEHRFWAKRGVDGKTSGVTFYGEKGTLVFDSKGWHIEDGTLADADQAADSADDHLRNFVDCVRSRKRPNADIEDGHKSTLVCHLGNVAWKLGRSVRFDPKTQTCPGDPEANFLLGREYRKPFVLPAQV